MPTKRLIAAAALAGALLVSLPLFAEPLAGNANVPAPVNVSSSLMGQMAVFAPAAALAQAAIPTQPGANAPAAKAAASGWGTEDDDLDADGMPNAGVAAVTALANDTSELRKTLIGLAMQLRDIRYVRGGHDPSTGFDCSGFVRYVFAHAVGLELPTNSASQFLAGLKVDRGDMQPGDLVFFRTAGRRGQGRISHVGIYIANGQFIHSPSRGKTVRVDSLDESYWAQRFAGAKRPGGLARS